MNDADTEIRLDKWLWAARFFRTRSLAKQAVDSGKVLYDGEKPKVSRIVRVGARLEIPQGHDRIEVLVRALSDRRGGAPQARLLYEETPGSVERRAQAAAQRKAHQPISDVRPSKRDRRLIARIKRGA